MSRLAPLMGSGLVLVTGLAGCGPSDKAKTQEKAAVERLERDELRDRERLNLVTTAGTAYRRDPVKGVKLYTISWKSAALQVTRPGLQEGKMNEVTGTVYEDEKTKSTFAAHTGYAKKATQTLYLEGSVVVKSPEYKAMLRAEKLEWLPDVKRYRATGNVTLTNPDGVSGPMPELLATADLRRVGTPDMFNRR